ncbi:pyrimidine 5'-nucleotidase [Sphingomonas quercus]|uniref:Pyrimidine 5'-nucleotidase n=1 Tax=Sphingomonas quercus TaxID=2842451 RepID=A0ABS6BH33_9SPHN|nr:pyrimidine 5'-nucleotidase [Sphingomonas quercus]MBU3076897.1 pyrimidine 5'-nucleotidase [Sphingomonas quercus]
MLPALAHVDTWIFDLDNTLYPAACDLFGQMDRRMTAYVARVTGLDAVAARTLQKSWFHEHGTTLAGLMRHHGIDPHHYLADVHDIDLEVVAEDRRLVAAIGRLPGRKLIFTNADAPYARRVLDRLGLSESFEAIHDIHACAYRPKPDPQAYRSMCDALGLRPETALFVEDMARNLAPAKALGMTTAWLDNGSEQGQGPVATDFIDYRIADLGHWLHELGTDA